MLLRLFILLLVITLLGCGGSDCEIRDLEVTVGACSCEDAYSLTIDFITEGSDSEFFELFARNGVLIGHYKLSNLPITIDKFQMSGLTDDYIKIRLNEDQACSKEYEFFPPDCSSEGECTIDALEIFTGDCLSSSDYQLKINFASQNTENELFDVFVRNQKLIGTYQLADLPLSIDSFATSGLEYDFIKVCINDNPDCCIVEEFMPPICENDCEIFDLTVDAGNCNSENTYNIKLDFIYSYPTSDYFDVYIRNNVKIGSYSFAQLPLYISDFEMSGNEEDFIKVCINDNPNCCQVIEFIPPNCGSEECEIFDLNVEVGECTSEDGYRLTLGFEYTNASHSNYEVFVRNNERIGNYPLSEIPLVIDDFKVSGKDYDYLKVCMSDNTNCCQEIEFMSPLCDEKECEIFDLVVEVKECTSDSTYNIVLDFEYSDPGNEYFDILVRQGEHYNYFKLSDLPVELIDFPMSGFDYDYLKVCINDVPNCCKEAEFMPPDC